MRNVEPVIATLTTDAHRAINTFHQILGPNYRLRNFNDDLHGIAYIGPSFVFQSPTLEGRQLQSKLLGDYERFSAIVRALICKQPEAVKRHVDQNLKTLQSFFELHAVWYESTEEVKAAAREAMERILTSLSGLYDPSDSTVVLVPDTNAVLHSPSFQDWQYPEISKFEILLVPTLLQELDQLKVSHRNQQVREKAQSVVRQIKEYRRRGSLNGGVEVVTGKIALRSIAVEPNIDDSLPWLDSQSQDDRLLASFIEVMRNHPRSSVILVTGDINLQNKAEFARLPFAEPPTLSDDS